MNIFEILNNLYTNGSGAWILELEDTEIQPYVIQRFLAMNDNIRNITRILDKYCFNIPNKMYLSLAWSMLPKTAKAPFVRYIKTTDELEDEYSFILPKIRKHFNMADNDFNNIKLRLINIIKTDKPNWFKYYGVEKKLWEKHKIDYEFIKDIKQGGLQAW